MTQREHAALASVSIPTMAAFERGEDTLTLTKAFDILRVVGLLRELPVGGSQDAFVREAFARWQALVKDLSPDSPGRFPHGWFRMDYCLEGNLHEPDLHQFRNILERAVGHRTGWPPFWLPKREAIAPREVDGTIECWMAPPSEEVDRMLSDPAHCDFSRGEPSGRMFLIRGYQEDGAETFPPGTVFDTTLPIWRMGEVLLHAASLAALLKEGDSSISIHFRVQYSGLAGRVLRAWANPLTDLHVQGGAARTDEAVLEATVPAENMEQALAGHLFPLVSSLYERFGVTGLSENFVAEEVGRLLRSKIDNARRRR
jgi:transcriptional regulator with XRE-family HTH domain